MKTLSGMIVLVVCSLLAACETKKSSESQSVNQSSSVSTISLSSPNPNRFVKKTLVANLDEPVKFAFFPNGDALIALRPGKLIRVDYKTEEIADAGVLNVAFLTRFEWGLVGLAIDPQFPSKPYIYTVFSVQNESGATFQRLSRFTWSQNRIDLTSERIILEFPLDKNCCHTGGDLQFGDNNELFFSTGDNTNPHDQEGFAPIDNRNDKSYNDALRSAGNTQDLRGKILRIRINDDGSYSIPKGNLFEDATHGRPEIYVMGVRNPYTITWDRKSKQLFFGDVGPDATMDSHKKGSRGYDEINRVTQAGNFGWPLVIGKNHPYRYFDYAGQESGELVDVQHPKNNSQRNTGITDLPPAQAAFIAYSYDISSEYPNLGTGGRTALVADVFHHEDYPESASRYPAYYDNKLFILDFMRSWIKVVSYSSKTGEVKTIEPFAPQIQYALPLDARFAPDGTLYVLEYGMSWFTHNPDARFSRIEFVSQDEMTTTVLPTKEISAVAGHQKLDIVSAGKDLVNAHNCLGCHDIDANKIGPAFKQIANKYKEKAEAKQYIAERIKSGSSGVWGAYNMPAFSGLSDEDRYALASYLMSFADK